MRYELLEDGVRIQILFRLIDDQRTEVLTVNSKVKKQQHDTAGSGRQLLDRDALVFDPVLNCDV
jgi:hypothetical protein